MYLYRALAAKLLLKTQSKVLMGPRSVFVPWFHGFFGCHETWPMTPPDFLGNVAGTPNDAGPFILGPWRLRSPGLPRVPTLPNRGAGAKPEAKKAKMAKAFGWY